jgi:hypothetical protein
VENAPALPKPFAEVLAASGRHLLLGEPLQAAPLRDATVVQSFLGGMALGRQSGGEILFLARSKLRF